MSVILVSITSLFLIITPGKSRLKSYYSGDAVSYQNDLYVATTNAGSLELFKLSYNNLNLVAKIKPFNYRFNKYGEFYDVKLAVENNRLYAYAVSNYTLYKYELKGSSLLLVKESKNTYWEWYNRVDIFGDDIVTVSAKGINIFSRDLEKIVTHEFNNKNAPYNITSSNERFYISINEQKSALEVYDKEAMTIVSEIPLNFNYDKGNRRAYQDSAGYIYVVDDYYAKKFDVSGKLLGSFRHLDYQGFDMSGTGHTDNVYFSNGVGVVKLNNKMEEVDYAWTGNLGTQGGWAMGLKTIYNNGDKVVVFNNTNILVLDDKLNKIATTVATEESEEIPVENLYLNLDKNRASVNSNIQVAGGGFFPYEQLAITFGKDRINSVTDTNGRFSSIISVPQLRVGSHDIRVEGVESGLHYSISFQVE